MNNAKTKKDVNEIYNIKGSNAPPMARGKPRSGQKAKGKRQKAKVEFGKAGQNPGRSTGSKRQMSSALQWGNTLSFELFTLNLPDRAATLLKMRDGPRGRQPDSGVPVALIHLSSVNLCVSSVTSVVKQKTADNQKSTENTERYSTHSIRTGLTAITARQMAACRRKTLFENDGMKTMNIPTIEFESVSLLMLDTECSRRNEKLRGLCDELRGPLW